METVAVSSAKCQFEGSMSYLVDLRIYFSGTKTYDVKGAGQSRASRIGVKLYDKNGDVKESEVFRSPALKEGESFSNEYVTFYNIEPGDYYIEYKLSVSASAESFPAEVAFFRGICYNKGVTNPQFNIQKENTYE